ncbi:UNC-like C-terminal-domain-containing protein [Syncephalastrum racemosum]|uniref:UNC-like C-terminal-domain-containing protein n=1 Tax=Syncephalastrum racemosum TaxID=13706 RepID=A0A1X2GZ52_SYNRA|nr:UNC-like C-terminal-domain-containing protein [Syncephalastrum racemosum]
MCPAFEQGDLDLFQALFPDVSILSGLGHEADRDLLYGWQWSDNDIQGPQPPPPPPSPTEVDNKQEDDLSFSQPPTMLLLQDDMSPKLITTKAGVLGQQTTCPGPSSHTTPSSSFSSSSSSSSSSSHTTSTRHDRRSGPLISFDELQRRVLQSTEDNRRIKHRKAGAPMPQVIDSLDGGLDDFGSMFELTGQHPPANVYHEDEYIEPSKTGGAMPSSTPEPKRRQFADVPVKSLKERFNYASIDCAAMVRGANKEAKGAQSILYESKDQYMLNKCAADKYVIINLCEAVLIDTIVMANFEFFSSTFSDFRVYVADRYPTKEWKLLGQWQARNTRDLQVFKVTNRIGWYENIKIEFLTHYGHEYYCPLSLVRVHGMPMMEYYNLVERHGLSDDVEENIALEEHFLWPAEVRDEIIQPKLDATNDSDAIIMMPENDDEDDRQQIPMIQPLPEQEEEKEEEVQAHETEERAKEINVEKEKKAEARFPQVDDDTPSPSKIDLETVLAGGAPTITSTQSASEESSFRQERQEQQQQQQQQQQLTTPLTSGDTEGIASTEPTQERSLETEDTVPTDSHVPPESSEDGSVVPNQGNGTIYDEQSSTSTPVTTATGIGTTTTMQGMPTGVNSMIDDVATRVKAHAMHTKENAQESIYKTIMKRLNALELNATLSQRYLDEQTKMLNDAFLTMEKNHQDQLILLLGRLNDTASFRIDSMKRRYEQLYEDLRYRSEKDAKQMTLQLGLLADQIAFERRVSMAQLVIVLLLFVFVALSRGTLSILSPIMEAQARERKRRESATEPPRHASPPKTKEKDEEIKRTEEKEEQQAAAAAVHVNAALEDNQDPALFGVVPSPSPSAPPSAAAGATPTAGTVLPSLPPPIVVPTDEDGASASSSVRHSPNGDLCHVGDASVYREKPPESPRRRWSDALSPDLDFLPSIRRRKSSGDA